MKEIINVEDKNLKRLDLYLSEIFQEVSRSSFKELIKDGHVLVNGGREKPSYKVDLGDRIEIEFIEEDEVPILPEEMELDIVYEDEYLAVINKSAGLVVHPGPGHMSGTLVNGLLYRFPKLSTINGEFRPGIVHRLDKDTAGLLVIAKDDKTHENLSLQFQNREVVREYRALVFGNIKEDQLRIETKIGRHDVNRQKMAVLDEGREAITNLEVLERFNDYSLLSLSLETGRTHQIRVHMNYINHPIVGDQVYSSGKNEFKLNAQFLQAVKLGFIHPSSGEYMEFESELTNKYKNIVKRLENRRDC